MKLKGRCPQKEQDQEGNRLGKMSHRRKEEHGSKTLGSHRKWKCVRKNN
jgi:hypothetical protein